MSRLPRQLLPAVFTMAVLQATAQAPANDACADPQPVACGTSVTGTTLAATTDVTPYCVTAISAPGVWYTVQGVSGSITVSTCTQFSFDTRSTCMKAPAMDCSALAGMTMEEVAVLDRS
ncbi:MAG: hypothetical protein IPP95_15215 [Flavobacteriales bacterium]|nr:MAG: hypothetical protein IPP95_15215 [Flavobacteriales bacterium]